MWSRGRTANLIWRILALAVFVYLTRNAVLRTREFYADLRASTWPDVAPALSRVLAKHGQARKMVQTYPFWQMLISVHPTSDERSQVLYDTRQLFRTGWWAALLALLEDLLVYNLPWILLFLASLFLFFRWIASGATVWLLAAATRQALRLIYVIGLLIAGVIFIGWSTQILQFSFITTMVIPLDKAAAGIMLSKLFNEMLHEPLTFLTLIGLWAFPLAIWFWRNHLVVLPSRNWAFLDAVSWSGQMPSLSCAKQAS